MQNTQNKERIFRTAKEKGLVTYQNYTYFSMETMKVRRSWADVLQTLRDHDTSSDPQRFESPLMEKTRYSMTKPYLNNMCPQTQSYRKY